VRTSAVQYRGTSLLRNSAPLAPYSRTMARALWWSWGGVLILMSEEPLYGPASGQEANRKRDVWPGWIRGKPIRRPRVSVVPGFLGVT
jgi:hypothetical protein